MRSEFDGIFSGMPVLVTGHTGFKGSWLSVWLRELGAQVIGYSVDLPTEPGNFQLCRLNGRMIDVRGDIRDIGRLSQTIDKYEPAAVIHLAAQPLVMTGYAEPKTTFDVNAGGVVNVLEAVRQATSVRALLVVTSDKVYEDQGALRGYQETDLLGGYDPYSASKAMAELATQAYRRSWQQQWADDRGAQSFSCRPVAIASARSGNVIGGGDFARYRLVPDCLTALLDGTPLVLRNPKSVRHWQFMLESISGYLWLVARLLKEQAGLPNMDEATVGEAWNFGPPADESITCEAVVDKCMELWGDRVPVTTPTADRVHETSVLKVNWEKAARRLGWSPVCSWDEALEQTVSWWKEYQRLTRGSVAVDMYDYAVRQIASYSKRARECGIEWACTSSSDGDGQMQGVQSNVP